MTQLDSHRVVSGRPPAVLEAQDLLQARLRVDRPGCRLKLLRGNREALVEPWQELTQHAVGFLNSARPGQTDFTYQTVLERSRRSLHPVPRLERQGEDHLIPQFSHGPAELDWHPGEARAESVSEDTVPVGVEGDG